MNRNFKGILLGSIGALVAAVIGAVIWVVIAKFTGYTFGVLGAAIAFMTTFIYEKLAKKMNVVGVIICVAFTCVAIYMGNRYAYLIIIKDELGCNLSEAGRYFSGRYDGNEAFRMEYIKNMAMAYVIGMGYTLFYVLSKRKNKA